MKHLKSGRKFSRTKKQREALMKLMLGNLFLRRKIATTLAKAKELKKEGEKMIGLMKKKQAARLLQARLPKNIDHNTVKSIAAATASRKSGYFRLIKTKRRLSDGAPMAIIELIEDEIIEAKGDENNEKK